VNGPDERLPDVFGLLNGVGMAPPSRPRAQRPRPAASPSADSTLGLEIRPFQPSDTEQVVSLWKRSDLVRPTNDPHRDIRRKRLVRPDLFLVGLQNGAIVGSVMAGYEGHRGWLNYVAVEPALRHRGLGRALVVEAERRLRLAGCPKINLQVRSSNAGVLEFYRRLGYTVDDVVSLGKRLEVDVPAATGRNEVQ